MEEETKMFVFDCFHVLKPIELCDGGQQIKPVLDPGKQTRRIVKKMSRFY